MKLVLREMAPPFYQGAARKFPDWNEKPAGNVRGQWAVARPGQVRPWTTCAGRRSLVAMFCLALVLTVGGQDHAHLTGSGQWVRSMNATQW